MVETVDTSIVKLFSVTFVALALLASVPQVRGQAGKPLPKITADQVSIHPYTANHRGKKIDPKTKGVFDEHRVTVTATKQTRIRISGKMKSAGGTLEGQGVLHLGKLALIPVSERSGTIEVGVPSIPDTTSYLIALETVDGKLVTEIVKLAKGELYNWKVLKKDGEFAFKVYLQGEEKWSIKAPEAQTKSFGIAAFTRWENNKAEIDFMID